MGMTWNTYVLLFCIDTLCAALAYLDDVNAKILLDFFGQFQ